MARLTGPDESVRTVFMASGINAGKAKAQGMSVPLYADENLTIPADVLTIAGAVIPGSTVTVDTYSRIPLIQYPDGVDTIWTSINGGPASALPANLDSRVDTLAARIGTMVSTDTIAAKGDLLVGTAPDTLDVLPVGGNGRLLRADSTQPGGMAWSTGPGLIRSQDDRFYRSVMCVIRNDGGSTGPAPYWQPINDTGHHPSNVDFVQSFATEVIVNYPSIAAQKVSSFQVTVDDGLAGMGVQVGASVGLTYALIYMYTFTTLADYVYYNGSAWVSADGVFTVSSFTGGVLTLTHPTLLAAVDQTTTSDNDLHLTGRGGVLTPFVSEATTPATDTGIKISFYDWAGNLITTPSTDMKVYVTRPSRKPRMLDPRLMTTTALPFTNLWIAGWFETAS